MSTLLLPHTPHHAPTASLSSLLAFLTPGVSWVHITVHQSCEYHARNGFFFWVFCCVHTRERERERCGWREVDLPCGSPSLFILTLPTTAHSPPPAYSPIFIFVLGYPQIVGKSLIISAIILSFPPLSLSSLAPVISSTTSSSSQNIPLGILFLFFDKSVCGVQRSHAWISLQSPFLRNLTYVA